MILITNNEGLIGAQHTAELLKTQHNGLQAMIAGIKIVEADPNVHTVGLSSWPNILGQLELDAAIMDGNTLRTGAIGALKGFKHPIEVAYRVMTDLNHELLVGAGAERFAQEIGAVSNINETDFSLNYWQQYLDHILTPEQKTQFPNIRLLDIKLAGVDPEHINHNQTCAHLGIQEQSLEKPYDTTIFLSLDYEHRISSATSTSGWAWKYPGRLGDSPIIGAGSYADSRYGACACTHTGEMTIRTSTSRSVVLYLKMGLSLIDAVYEAAKDLGELNTGYLGEVTIHAIDKHGQHKVLGVNSAKPITYTLWQDNLQSVQVQHAEIIKI